METTMRNGISVNSRMVAVATALLIGLSTGPVFAEDDQNELRLETMTVTAQKQEENIQEVPASISTVNEMDIEDRRIESIYDIADFTPGLSIPNNGASGYNSPCMRGVGSGSDYGVPVGLYIDSIPKLGTIGYDEAFLDIERVEVLRGPQGTLYGRNAEAGVINIISRQPDNELKAKLSLEIGEDEKKQATFYVSGPIQKDKFYFGIAGLYYDKKGFIENSITGDTFDDRSHVFGKVHLRWTPSDKADISLIASQMTWDEGGMRQNLTEEGAASYGVSVPKDREVTSNLDGKKNTSKDETQALKIEYDLTPSVKLTSVTAHAAFYSRYDNDLDYSNTTVYHMLEDSKFSKLSQELRLNLSQDRFKWLIGLYFDSDDNNVKYTTESIWPGYAGETDQKLTGTSKSIFAHVTYSFLDDLSVSTGLRYDQEEKDYKSNLSDTKLDENWSQVSPKLSLQYNFQKDGQVYVTAAKGYRSGGFNATVVDSSYRSYDEEILWSYEIGEKMSFLNGQLILNGCVFVMDVDNMQVKEAIGGSETYLTNAAEATGHGIELELTARPIQNLDIIAGYGQSEVRFDEFEDSAGDYEGNLNPFTPKYSYSFGMQYRLGNGFFFRGDLIGYGKMYLDKANEYTREAYNIVNTKIGYEMDQFDIYLYAKNLFDEEYDAEGYFSGCYVIYSDPREIGVRLVARF